MKRLTISSIERRDSKPARVSHWNNLDAAREETGAELLRAAQEAEAPVSAP